MAPVSIRIALFTGSLALFGCTARDQPSTISTQDAARTGTAARRIEMTVTPAGFVPALAHVKVGEPVTLVITRTTDRTCATDIVIKDYGINQPLPENKPVEVTLTPTKAGSIRYACAMDMMAGELIAE